jgi:flagellar assembly protein FliH
MQAQATPKFLFDRDFDDLEILREIVEQEVEELEQAKIEAEEPAVPAAPTFSEEEMAAARKQAYEKGKHDGIAEALAGVEQRTSVVLDKVAGAVETLFATQAKDNEALARDTAHLALAVARKLFPKLYEAHGLGEIVGVTEAILANLIREPRLVVLANEANTEPLRARLTDFLAKRGFSGTLDVRSDATLGPADCRIEWMGGDAARDTTALFAEIESIVERHVGGMPATETPMPLKD